MRLLLLGLLLGPGARAAVFFREQFLDGAKWQERWVPSQNRDNYGKFRLTAGAFYGDRELDKGLQTSENLKFYAISARFQPFSNAGRPLVLQYTVKHEQKMDCGGGYVKLFPADLDQRNMSSASPYYVMFGPDICSSDIRKVHVILRHKDKLYPIKREIRCKVDGFTHLYTLILRPDHTYQVKIDNARVASGLLEDDWAFLPPRTINDPRVEKPRDWDDRPEVDDPDDTKPEDWDVSEFILDTSAERPADWDEGRQGRWQPPLLQNPLYRGEWKPRRIPNPKFRGAWPHPQVANPAFAPDASLAIYRDIGAIGLDLWQVRSGTIFDNFLIADDEEYAEEFGEDTWGETKDPEQEMNKQQIEEERRKEQMEEERKREERKAAKKEKKEKEKKKKKKKKKKEGKAPREEL
ncbi:calreticulin-3 isoform X2 [Anolis carolinensis]|uniref:calreticulin-3 isoform X2 n=1 Tax=Anolis carolinensis TaxID=28377 RepID=UPI002F2B3FA4